MSKKTTLAEMRAAGVRGVLIYCDDYKCAHRSTHVERSSCRQQEDLPRRPEAYPPAGRARTEGEGEMIDQPTESRFVLRKDARGKWMVWDRNVRGPAKLELRLATRLSEERARQILKQLRRAHGEK